MKVADCPVCRTSRPDDEHWPGCPNNPANPPTLTTAEWMALPLTVKNVDDLRAWLEKTGGIRSDWPWPLILKVLDVARQAALVPDPLSQSSSPTTKSVGSR